MLPFDLHVLGTPPAFILSQDQTLMFNLSTVWTIAFVFRRDLSRLLFLGSSVRRVLFVLFKNFRDCITVQLSRFSVVVCDSFVNITQPFSFVNNFFKKLSIFSFLQESTKFFNGEGGIWTLAPLLTTCTLSRGVPSASWVLLQTTELVSTYSNNDI